MAVPNPPDDFKPILIDKITEAVGARLSQACSNYEDIVRPYWEAIEYELHRFEEQRRSILDAADSVLAPGFLKRCLETDLGAIEPAIQNRMRSHLFSPRAWSPTLQTLPLTHPDGPSACNSAISDSTTLGPTLDTSRSNDRAAPSTTTASPTKHKLDPQVDGSRKRSKQSIDNGHMQFQPLDAPPNITRTVDIGQVQGKHWIFLHPGAGLGYFVILCNDINKNPHRFVVDPWITGKAHTHLKTVSPKNKCHGINTVGDYSHSAIMNKFGYRVTGDFNDECVNQSNQSLDDSQKVRWGKASRGRRKITNPDVGSANGLEQEAPIPDMGLEDNIAEVVEVAHNTRDDFDLVRSDL